MHAQKAQEHQLLHSKLFQFIDPFINFNFGVKWICVVDAYIWNLAWWQTDWQQGSCLDSFLFNFSLITVIEKSRPCFMLCRLRVGAKKKQPFFSIQPHTCCRMTWRRCEMLLHVVDFCSHQLTYDVKWGQWMWPTCCYTHPFVLHMIQSKKRIQLFLLKWRKSFLLRRLPWCMANDS